jgi:SMODS-associating 2TM, beta-strand rich effector domain
VIKGVQLNILVGLVLLVVAIVAAFEGEQLPAHILSSFSYVVTGVSAALLLWDRFFWKFPIFYPWLTKRPNLAGTWKGEVMSDFVQPGRGHGPIEVYLVIRQTFSEVTARMFSLESVSTSLSADVVLEAAGVQTLSLIYRNEPTVLIREKSPIHYGGMLLTVRGEPVKNMDGEYWTDRKTKGNARFLSRVRSVGHDFASSALLFRARPLTPRKT